MIGRLIMIRRIGACLVPAQGNDDDDDDDDDDDIYIERGRRRRRAPGHQ